MKTRTMGDPSGEQVHRAGRVHGAREEQSREQEKQDAGVKEVKPRLLRRGLRQGLRKHPWAWQYKNVEGIWAPHSDEVIWMNYSHEEGLS